MRSSLLVVTLLCYVYGGTSKITVKNNCPYTIWPGTLTSRGGNLPTGFELVSQASTVFYAEYWSGRIWARSGCSSSRGRFQCLSGDCGSGRIQCDGAGGTPPASLVEFTTNGDGNKDYYDLSLVDGFNFPISVAPQTGGCPTVSCPVDINNHGCPEELAVRDGSGGVVGCKSACFALSQPQYCCTGEYSTPEKCKPTNYSEVFKQRCPQAYSYAYDDKSSLFTCPSGTNYLVTFCP